jgi:hypothetical protein
MKNSNLLEICAESRLGILADTFNTLIETLRSRK